MRKLFSLFEKPERKGEEILCYVLLVGGIDNSRNLTEHKNFDNFLKTNNISDYTKKINNNVAYEFFIGKDKRILTLKTYLPTIEVVLIIPDSARDFELSIRTIGRYKYFLRDKPVYFYNPFPESTEAYKSIEEGAKTNNYTQSV